MGEARGGRGAAAPHAHPLPLGCPPVELSYLCSALSLSNGCFSLFVVDCGPTVIYSERQLSCNLLNMAGQHIVEVTRLVTRPRRWMMSAVSAGPVTAVRLVSSHTILA
jgi:hypothetical protein